MKLMPLTIVVATVLLCSACKTLSPAQQNLNQGQHYFMRGEYQQSLWYINQAAVAGDPHGMYVLGYMYYNGLGLPRDDAAAHYWISRAAQAGYAPARTALTALQQSLQHQSQQSADGLDFPALPPPTPINSVHHYR